MTSTAAEVDRGRALSPMGQGADLLFALFQGGGNLALMLPIVAAAVARRRPNILLACPLTCASAFFGGTSKPIC
jgi:hypothetical protein